MVHQGTRVASAPRMALSVSSNGLRSLAGIKTILLLEFGNQGNIAGLGGRGRRSGVDFLLPRLVLGLALFTESDAGIGGTSLNRRRRGEMTYLEVEHARCGSFGDVFTVGDLEESIELTRGYQQTETSHG